MPEVEKIIKDIKLPKNFKVLEIGPGRDVEFKNYFENLGGEWTGIDVEGETSPNFHIGNMDDLSFNNNSFDLVFSCHSFEHCENPIKALKEMKRVSKKFILILTPYHCIHQVIKADVDHIFCLTQLQMTRLFMYVGIGIGGIHVQKIEGLSEQDYNLISLGDVEVIKEVEGGK